MALKRFLLLATATKLLLLIFLQFLHFAYQSWHLSLHPHVLHVLEGRASALLLAPPPLLNLSPLPLGFPKVFYNCWNSC